MAARKSKSLKGLQAHIGYWLRVVSNSVSRAFAQKLDASGVTVAEWVVLRVMYREDEMTSPSAVAQVAGLSRGAVSKLIERLLRKSLVTRTEAGEDRRFQEIKLTPQAISLVPKLARLADMNDDEFFSVLSGVEKARLTQTLKKLAVIHKLKKVPIQ